MKKNLFLAFLPSLLFFTAGASAQQLKLWYEQPAKIWEEALPLGNSRLGAMVYGVPQREEIQLNEETIWGGGPYRNDNPKALGALPEIRQMVFDGKRNEANNLINQTLFTKTHGMPFQSAGSVIINFHGHENFHHYYRELDIEKAVATTQYVVDDVKFERQTIASFADDVIVMHLTASKRKALTFDLEYNPKVSQFSVSKEKGALVLRAGGTDHEGVKGEIRYQIHSYAKNKGGEVILTDNKLSVKDADEVTIYISIGTNFIDYQTVGANEGKRANEKLRAAISKNFGSARDAHSAKYARQFGRFRLNLGENAEASPKPTNVRIAGFKDTQDPSLVTLLMQFGRYLLISSSQPGGQPANLQGIWANSLVPPWDSKYTININTEMNYWPAEVTNLSETHEPLFQMVRELSESGRGTAKTLYGAEGWVTHHNTDLWRVTSPIDFALAGMWPTGGAWLVQHLWEHYLFTGDKKFLATIYPAMKGSADFFLSSLVKHPRYGWMVVNPSVSPEHGPISAGCTMDNQIVFDILTRTAQANQILGGDETYRQQLTQMAEKLPPMQVGKYSQLQEWLEDLDNPQDEHRHVSHLYGLYPGNQISPYKSPQLFEAARNSLTYRGDMATGWSIGWKINLWARLLDGNHAYKIINNMLTLADKDNKDGRTYPNMFTAHPPFQIDGNFGLAAGVAEMLVQSHDGAVHLLPAVPEAWKTGEVSGIKARGGFEISMKWRDGKVTEVRVLSKLGGNLRLRSYTPLMGKNMKPASGDNPNILLNPNKISKPIISNEARLKGLDLKQIFEYDIPTKAGKTYRFN